MSTSRAPEITVQDGVTVIELGPEYESLDEPTLEDLREAILEAARDADPPLVVLDLSHTRFFGSAFIEILFRSWNRLNRREGGRFCISGVKGYCREIIEVTHLDRLWDVFESREDAIRALSGSK